MEDSQASGGNGSGILIRIDAVPGGFTSHQLHTRFINEIIEDPHGVAAAADTGDQHIRKFAFRLQKLGFYFPADNALEIADDRGERVGAHDGTQYIVGILHPVRPLAQCFVDCIL